MFHILFTTIDQKQDCLSCNCENKVFCDDSVFLLLSLFSPHLIKALKAIETTEAIAAPSLAPPSTKMSLQYTGKLAKVQMAAHFSNSFRANSTRYLKKVKIAHSREARLTLNG